MIHGQKHKDPLSLIMHDFDQETYKTEEIKEEESIMGNTELIRNSLEELLKMLENYLGEDIFRDGIRDYLNNFKYSIFFLS